MSNPSVPRDKTGGPMNAGPRLADRLEVVRGGVAPTLQSARAPAYRTAPPPHFPAATVPKAVHSLSEVFDASGRLVGGAGSANEFERPAPMHQPRHPGETMPEWAHEPHANAQPVSAPAYSGGAVTMSAEAAREPVPLFLALVPRAAASEHYLDVRGFLMGFALSAAIGAALYFFLVAGVVH